MAKFIVKATLTKDYEVEVEANDEMDAIKKLDDWIADDFEDYEVGARWDFEA
jgi:phosphotransferase system HPr-like phosphotransfer protein